MNVLINDIITSLEKWSPISLQESYDNCGLLVGNRNAICTGVLCTLDVTEQVLQEAKENNCNIIVAHHPIIFGGLKKITGKNFVERIVIDAIKNNIAIYAIHTNLDNVSTGVNSMFAQKIGLQNTTILSPKNKLLKKLYTYIVPEHVATLRDVLFAAGAGNIGNYSECSFSVVGDGSFKGNAFSNPSIGEPLIRTTTKEVKIEFLFPAWKEAAVVAALHANHYYEEVAYEIISLDNINQEVGSGMVGYLESPMDEQSFLQHIQQVFGVKAIRHTQLLHKPIQKVAICGGSGSFLINNALAAKVDVFITADVKYHDFFEPDGKMLLLDIGHYETEQFTTDLIFSQLQQKFTTFAVLKTKVNTNSVHYFV